MRKRVVFASIGQKSRLKKSESTLTENRFKQSHNPPSCAPPPGTYDNVLAINSHGHYPTTYVPNVLCSTFKSRIELQKVNDNPGPGYYQNPSDFGIYVSAKVLGMKK